ncbi:glutaredoxin 3 [Pseudoalteromonas piratica]|jgi:glutaredoxin 3|uniref:Glutaredoxin n=1 Tax=Pseudoalteromonas piratica TaxID=1348114 RepID=A0A0A7EJI2_9GAMM|nr:glutaredoxin 3 [Pseudoalteromonas piratica]AIY66097.1 glutaredoxin [Pseudoalteromonas piratica]
MANIVIYTKPTCPFCIRAKMLLTQKGVEFSEIDIAAQPELRDEMIAKANGGYTVPQIFINDQHIGGCDDMFALNDAGRLDNLLV